jgi:hypothetical protein
LRNKVASIFGSRALLRDKHATPRRPVEKIEVPPLHHQAIDFPDISRVTSKFIVAFVIPCDQQTPRPMPAALPDRARS